MASPAFYLLLLCFCLPPFHRIAPGEKTQRRVKRRFWHEVYTIESIQQVMHTIQFIRSKSSYLVLHQNWYLYLTKGLLNTFGPSRNWSISAFYRICMHFLGKTSLELVDDLIWNGSEAFCATQKLNAVIASRQIPPSGFSFDPISRMVRTPQMERGGGKIKIYTVQCSTWHI